MGSQLPITERIEEDVNGGRIPLKMRGPASAMWADPGETLREVPKDVQLKKVMLSIWWDVRGPVLWQLLDEGATVTANLYTEQLRDLKRVVDQRQGIV
ncbi:transposase [Teladorsagia circumcincta]|uniref:Transposase n=1 Tax=Teladorsagia circumcincta TaxID=45464 RepID=A0A2G9USA4_TELCI|nr:transposase [Teladorsagia circumcincta]